MQYRAWSYMLGVVVWGIAHCSNINMITNQNESCCDNQHSSINLEGITKICVYELERP